MLIEYAHRIDIEQDASFNVKFQRKATWLYSVHKLKNTLVLVLILLLLWTDYFDGGRKMLSAMFALACLCRCSEYLMPLCWHSDFSSLFMFTL